MPLTWFKCLGCFHEFRTKKESPIHCEGHACEKLLSTPTTTFYEKKDKDSNKSVLVNQDKILKERARAHSRNTMLDELIQTNPQGVSQVNNWVNDKGEPRKKIDEL